MRPLSILQMPSNSVPLLLLFIFPMRFVTFAASKDHRFYPMPMIDCIFKFKQTLGSLMKTIEITRVLVWDELDGDSYQFLRLHSIQMKYSENIQKIFGLY